MQTNVNTRFQVEIDENWFCIVFKIIFVFVYALSLTDLLDYLCAYQKSGKPINNFFLTRNVYRKCEPSLY